jgi:hypothetical protein
MILPDEIKIYINSFIENIEYQKILDMIEKNQEYEFYIHWDDFNPSITKEIFEKIYIKYLYPKYEMGHFCCNEKGVQIRRL